MMIPVVSVLMTCYNREDYLEESIKSVLSSYYTDFELVIVDDCSSDGSVEIAKRYQAADSRVRVYVNEVNLGDYNNRNKAASYAKGKYLKYLDSDDMIYPYSLGVFVDAMEKYPSAALGVNSRNPVPLSPFPILLKPEDAYRKHFFKYGLLDFGPSGVIIRKDIFEELGGFSGKRYVGDSELWLKVSARYPIIELPPALIFWRQHEQQEYLAGQQEVDKGYSVMSLPVLEEAFSRNECPLTEAEKKKVLGSFRKTMARQLIKHVIKKGELDKVRKVFGSLGLKLTDAI